MRAKRWLAVFLALTLLAFLCTAALTAYVDPFFHYHAPLTDRFFYVIDNERSQNDGILRHFDYDAVVTGTSMTANFNTSELDALFGTHSVKIPASGGTAYEIGGLIETAIRAQPKVKTVFRSIDRHLFLFGSGRLRGDLGEYPSYLYDDSLLNDYKYLLNADVAFGRAGKMLLQSTSPDFSPGITSFDDYANTMEEYVGRFGLPELESMLSYPPGKVGYPMPLTDNMRLALTESIEEGVVAPAKAHPEVTFYCFFPPYSLGFWSEKVASGEISALLEAEKLAAELMLECDNIRLYDFDCRLDILSDVNHYRDLMHYGEWVNSLILKWMHEDAYRLTKENYRQRLEDEAAYYLEADYSSLLTAERYGCDYYAAALVNEELTGQAPRAIGAEELLAGELRHAQLEPDEAGEGLILTCLGTLPREPGEGLAEYLRDCDYIGLKLSLPDAADYSYLCFQGRNMALNGQPAVFVYDEAGNTVEAFAGDYRDLQGGWQRFAVDLRKARGPVEIVFQGGYTDCTGSEGAAFAFRDFMLY